MSNLSPLTSPLISPTKARRDAAQAQDWAYVSSWLAKKYSPQPVPRFERNGETLSALLELVAANENADHEVELIQRAEEEELRRYEDAFRGDGGPCRSILEALEESLDESGTNALIGLAEASLVLGTLSTNPMSMGERIVELSQEKFEMEEQLRRVADLQSQMEREMETMKMGIEKIQSNVDEVAQEDMQQRTAQLIRETKQFTTKVGEYGERTAALEKFNIASPTIPQVRDQEQTVKTLQAKVAALKQRIANLHGLPPDLEASRRECQRAQGDLQELRRRRNGLFANMID